VRIGASDVVVVVHHSFITIQRRTFIESMTTSRVRATVIEGRGPAFVDPGTTIELFDASSSASARVSTGPSETMDARGGTPKAAWRRELDDVELAETSSTLTLVARDSTGRELGRGGIDLGTLRASKGTGLTPGGIVPGRWCAVVDASGATRGTVCVRVKVTATGAKEEDLDLEREYNEGRPSSVERERVKTEVGEGDETPRRAPWRGAADVAHVAARWLSGIVARRRLDEEAREEMKERKRREREAMVEEKRVRKERERIEREEKRAAEEESKAKLENLQREAKAQWDEEEREKRRETSESEHAVEARGKFHVPNVEEIKHTLAEGAHRVGDVAHRVGDVIKEKGDKFVHGVSDQVHHVGDKIRDTNNRVGKALAKKRWVRDVASRLSPNSVLVVAIAVFLAGLPENREAAARKTRSMKKNVRQSRANDASNHSKYSERGTRDDGYADVVYNADDVEDDAAYIGRGPTPRGVYEVVEGDTLCSIAGCFNLDVVEIIDKNGDVIQNPDELAPGDRIRIY